MSMATRFLVIAWVALWACTPVDVPMNGNVDAGDVDSGHGPDSGPPPVLAPEMYDPERTLSPITPYVAEHLRTIDSRDPGLRDNVFAKVGDSATVSSSFLHCLASPVPGDIDLSGRDELASTIGYFRDGNAAGSNPFERPSRAAAVGWKARSVLDSAALDLEYSAIRPRFAVIMVGTNDLRDNDMDAYGNALYDITERFMELGVIPVLTSLMPRDDDPALSARVPRYNGVVRGVAQARQVPFIDLYRELLPLPDHGLGPDGVHPSVYREGQMPRACVFSPAGLGFGYNTRNLLTLRSLHRLVEVVLDNQPAPDAPTHILRGAGTAEEPFAVTLLPFSHGGDTRDSASRQVDRYDGCGARQDESGPEVIYRLDVDRPTRIRAQIIDRGSADIDIHLMRGGSSGEHCFARADQVVTAELEPGTYYVNVDTYVRNGDERAGEYLLVLLEENQ